jgi:hypothetical protein
MLMELLLLLLPSTTRAAPPVPEQAGVRAHASGSVCPQHEPTPPAVANCSVILAGGKVVPRFGPAASSASGVALLACF